MATFTTTQAGNWSSNATWGGGGHPGSGDSAFVNHAVTVDVDTTVDAVGMTAALTVAAGKIFTLRAGMLQANALFTLGAAAQLVGDTSVGNVNWLSGTANSQTNCRIVATGTLGSECWIKRTGSGSFWFDGGEEGSGAFGNCGGWDCTYTKFKDLGHNSLAWSIRSNDFGLHHRRFNHCSFDNCKYQFAATYNWDANANADWQVQYCSWINQPAGASGAGMRYVWGSTGSGSLTFNHNSVGEPSDAAPSMTLAPRNAHIDDNYFDSAPAFSGAVYASFDRNTVRMSANTQSCRVTNGCTATYMLCDHCDPADRVNGVTHVGNPHIMESIGHGTFDGLVLDYPHALLIDGGDGIYGSEDGTFAGSVIQNVLVLPSLTDGVAGANVHPMVQQNNQIKMYHNTIVGKIAQLVFNERNVTGTIPVLEVKSNLVAGVATTGTDWGAGCYDLHGNDINQVDTIPPANITNNYLYQPIPDDATVPGGEIGWRLRLSAPPNGTNTYDTTTGPQFVDSSRCAATWAVYKSAVGADPGTSHTGATWKTWKRDALDAVRTLLMADPTLGYSDLLPWVRAGFAPQNVVLQNAGHDGVTIGAVAFAGAGGSPPPAAPTDVVFCGPRQGGSSLKR